MKRKFLLILTIVAFCALTIEVISVSAETGLYFNNVRTETIAVSEKTFIVNPINVQEGQPVILALYNNGMFLELHTALYNGTGLTFSTEKDYTDAKVMVLKNFETMTPVCQAEIVDLRTEAEYEESIVDVVREVKDGRIYFENGASTISYTDNTKLVILKNGEIAELSALETNDVVTILRNEIITVIEVVNKTIEGTIDSKDTVDGRDVLRIDGTYYKITTGANGNGTLTCGFEGTFYLNKYNDIVYWKSSKMEIVTAYVLDIINDDAGNWGNSVLQVRLLATDGIMIFDVAEDFYLDDEPLSHEAAAACLRDIVESDGLIKYSLLDGKISKVYTTNNTDEFKCVEESFLVWNSQNNTFDGYNINANSIVFNINTEDVDKSSVISFDNLVNREEYWVRLYATSDTVDDADIVLIYDLFL